MNNTMTRKQAEAEARRRWGRRGRVVDFGYGWCRFVVGQEGRGGANEKPLGAGFTWEDAFADADRRWGA